MKRLLMILVCTLVPAFLVAGPVEITVHSGWSFLNAKVEYPVCPVCFPPYPYPQSESKINQSALFGFKTGVYLNDRFEVEGAFAVAPNHNHDFSNSQICIPENPCVLARDFIVPFGNQRENVVTYQYEGNFVYNFLKGDTKPFFTFGIGGVSSDFEQTVANNFAFNFGGGTKFYFNNVGVRLEVNDHVMPNYFLNQKTEHDVQIQYGLIFRLFR